MLARARLVSTGAESVEVAHESLATAWPRLQAWLEEDAESARILTMVVGGRGGLERGRTTRGRPVPRRTPAVGARMARRGAARPHRRRGRVPRRVGRPRHRGAGAARRTCTTGPSAESPPARPARRRRRTHRAARRRGFGRRGSSQEASAQRDSATIEALVATALALRTSERDVSALLAAEAYRRWPDDPRTRSGLLGVLQGAGGFLGNTSWPIGGSAYGSVIPGTGDVARGHDSGDAASGTPRRETSSRVPRPRIRTRHAPALIRSMEVSGDGRVAAVLWPAVPSWPESTWYGTSPQSELVVFDLETRRRIVEPERARRRERVRSP